MEPIVLALASNESYFPGLYCAIASALVFLNPEREVDVKMLDGGLSYSSRESLSRLVRRMHKRARLEFVPVDASIFGKATLGPGQSHMAYCRLLLPHLLDVPRLIYLDSDVLVFRDLSELYDLQLSEGKAVAAVSDSETLCLGEDSALLATAIRLPPAGTYFNSGVMLMNLSELRRDYFFQRAVEFLNTWSGKYRFHDQSAINFLLHERIQPLSVEWNWPAWRFDEQENNNLNCVLHYTTSAPWSDCATQAQPGVIRALCQRSRFGQRLYRRRFSKVATTGILPQRACTLEGARVSADLAFLQNCRTEG